MIFTRRNIRMVLLVLLLSLSGGVVLLVFTHKRLVPPEQISEDMALAADARLSDFRYTQLEAGRIKWILAAGRGTHDTKRSRTLLEEVRAEFFGDTAADNIVMTAAEADADIELEKIEARGDVVMTMMRGYRLKTPVLEYVGDKALALENLQRQDQMVKSNLSHIPDGNAGGIIRTAAYVELESDKINIQGHGMTYQLEPRVLSIHNDVEAQIFPSWNIEK